MKAFVVKFKLGTGPKSTRHEREMKNLNRKRKLKAKGTIELLTLIFPLFSVLFTLHAR